MDRIRVVIADDHPLARAGLRTAMEGTDTVEIVGEAADGDEALNMVRQLHPDVAVLDVEMPGISGSEVAMALHEDGSQTRILALSGFDDEEYILHMLRANAAGYFTKEQGADRIVEAIVGIAGGEMPWLSPRAAAKLAAKMCNGALLTPSKGNLTFREKEILVEVAKGKSNSEIASEFVLHPGTVKNYVSKILVKTNSSNRREAIEWARRTGMVS